MNVARAAQVLSKTVASSLRVVSLWHEGAGIPNCSDTADMVGQMVTIWDSVNGYVNGKKADPNKPYRCPLTSESPHLGYYPVAKQWMYSIQFKDKFNKTHRPPCQDGWISLLDTIPIVWRELEALGFESLNLRYQPGQSGEFLRKCTTGVW